MNEMQQQQMMADQMRQNGDQDTQPTDEQQQKANQMYEMLKDMSPEDLAMMSEVIMEIQREHQEQKDSSQGQPAPSPQQPPM